MLEWTQRVLPLVFMVACTPQQLNMNKPLSLDPSNSDSVNEEKHSFFSLPWRKKESLISVYIDKAKTEDTWSSVLKLSSVSCQQKDKMKWIVEFSTPFGRDELVLDLPPSAFVQGAPNEIPAEIPLLQDLQATICKEWDEDPSYALKLEQEESKILTKSMQSILGGMLPDCSFVLTQNGGWNCKMPVVTGQQAKERLQDFEHEMLIKWKRQPYLLTRRLAVSNSLAQITTNRETMEKNYKQFCTIIENSTQKELPLVLNEIKWQRNFCAEENMFRFELAEVGLHYSLKEIQFLISVNENSSRLGSLTLHIPNDGNSGKDIWVKLQPKGDVHKTIESACQEVRNKQTHPVQNKMAPFLSQKLACWHPLYKGERIAYARYLGLAQEGEQSLCLDPHSPTPANYVAESISGETAFFVTLGQAKTLRLPVGTYGYTLYKFPPNSPVWNQHYSDAHVSGSIAWGEQKPNPVISKW